MCRDSIIEVIYPAMIVQFPFGESAVTSPCNQLKTKLQESGTLVWSYQRAHKTWLHREGKSSLQQQLVASAFEVLLEFDINYALLS